MNGTERLPGAAQTWHPKFDAVSYKQEQLALAFSAEIGQGGRPDSIRLLEMAEALYGAERDDFAASTHYERHENDPTLKRTNVKIAYRASDGHIAEMAAKAGLGSKHLKTGEEVPPQVALLAGVEELARLCELFGFGAEALQRVTVAQARVRDDMERRARLRDRPVCAPAHQPTP